MINDLPIDIKPTLIGRKKTKITATIAATFATTTFASTTFITIETSTRCTSFIDDIIETATAEPCRSPG